MENIGEKIRLYCEIYDRLYDIVSKANPEHAIEIALGIFSEIARDLRTERIAQLRLKVTETETIKEFATKKQREALHKFGVKCIPEGLSKEEASEALDLLVNFSKAGDNESLSRIIQELNRRWTEKVNQLKK